MAHRQRRTPRTATIAAALLLAAAVVGQSHPARANGAFPDAFQILLPAQQPQQILLGTNFGLVISDDDGKTWSWTCEQHTNLGANLYQLGPAPTERIFALSQDGLVHSDDQSCTWTAASGSFPDALAFDAFPDPTNAARVWAIAQPLMGGPGVYLSTDGGLNFGAPLFVDLQAGGVTSVESARSEPQTVYLAMYQSRPVADSDAGDDDGGEGDAGDVAPKRKPFPQLLRSTDGGAHWDAPIELQPMLGYGTFRLISVDPANPQKLFIRFTPFEVQADALAVSDDGGLTFRAPIHVRGSLSAFLRTSDGTLLVAGEAEAGWVGFRSSDGGATFTDWPNIPRIRGLAERGGRLYVAADWVKDGYALGVSTDHGVTFSKVMTFSEVASVKACVKPVCMDSCLYQAGIGLWPQATCAVAVTPPVTPTKKTGCGCQIDGGDGAEAVMLAVAAVLVVGRSRRRVRRVRR